MAKPTCSIPECGRPVRHRGWCNRHWLRWRRHGDPLGGRPSWDDFVMPTEKACTRCHETKPLALFNVRSSARDGRSPWCKACFTEYSRTNRRVRQWGYKPETRDGRERYERMKEYHRAYYLEHRAEKLAQARAYKQANSEARREWERQYREANRERLTAASREYQRRVGFKYSKARLLGKRTRVVDYVDRNEVYRRFGGLCGICAAAVDPLTFHVDHIIPISRGGEHSYANTQPAHPVCNLRKGAREWASSHTPTDSQEPEKTSDPDAAAA